MSSIGEKKRAARPAPRAAGSRRESRTAGPDRGSRVAGETRPSRVATASDADLCETHPVHEEAVEAALREASPRATLDYLADTFQVLANPTRLRIVEALSRRELCVCDLAAAVESSQSAVSHHLRQLRQMKIVRYRKDGRMAYYRLDDQHIEAIFRMGLEHVEE